MEILKYIKSHGIAFFSGFIPSGTIVTHLLLGVPAYLGLVGFLLKLFTAVLFAAAGGLATVLVTDIYNHYLKGWVMAQIEKLVTFIRKRKNHDRKRDQNKAA